GNLPRPGQGLTAAARAGPASDVVVEAVVLGGDAVLAALQLHDALAPGPLGVALAQALRPARRRLDLRQRELRRAVGVQQAVGLLVGVRELRVAEARQRRQRVDDRQQAAV